MKRVLVALSLLGLALLSLAAASTSQVLREELKIQEEILKRELAELQVSQGRVEAAWVRVQRESADLIRAQEQGEDLESLRLRDQDLRQAEAELEMHISEARRLRGAVLDLRLRIEQTLTEVRRLEGKVGAEEDPLTGTWRVVAEPGGQEGSMSLVLDGTLVNGTYQLDGGWSGSLRGTLVAGKVRLERIDSQIGFASIYYGQLSTGGAQPKLEGRWEATQLASGLPSSGSWVAERVEEQPE